MSAYKNLLACLLVGVGLSACSVPPYVLFGDQTAVAPAGPKVAALMANLKCELWEAAHSDRLLPYYYDDPTLTQKSGLRKNPNRDFTLHNLFEEIEYVAAAEYTLDVTQSASADPSANFITPFSAATNYTLAVSGQASDAAHRYVNIYTSVDFSRLVASEPTLSVQEQDRLERRDRKFAKRPEILPCDSTNSGVEDQLAGEIGLEETLATGIIADSMNDVALFNPAPSQVGGKLPSNIQDQGGYAFGLISAEIDFTVVAGAAAGPNWTLAHFKGPMASGGGSLLFNVSRQVKDTLTIAFVPVCIRDGYVGFKKVNGRLRPLTTPLPPPPYEYGAVKPSERLRRHIPEDRKMIVGTPGWANYLPPCSIANKTLAYQAGVNTIKLQQLHILLPQ